MSAGHDALGRANGESCLGLRRPCLCVRRRAVTLSGTGRELLRHPRVRAAYLGGAHGSGQQQHLQVYLQRA
ncbi:MAG: hypothetical protein ACJ8AW_33060 [Rhodopila sp.]